MIRNALGATGVASPRYSDQWLGREPTRRELSEEFRYVCKLLQEAQERLDDAEGKAEELANSRVAVTIRNSGGVRPLAVGAKVVSELTAPGQYKATCPSVRAALAKPASLRTRTCGATTRAASPLRAPAQVRSDIGAISDSGFETPRSGQLVASWGLVAGSLASPYKYTDIIPGRIEIRESGVRLPHIALRNSDAMAYIDLYTDSSGEAGFTLYASGVNARVGVNRMPRTHNLEVGGSASKSTAGDWLANSDARIKQDVQDAVGLDAIRRLRPVTFKYKPTYLATENGKSIEDRVYHNFIAQEFAEVFPEAVQESNDIFEGNKILQVDTHNALIAAIAAIKELDAEVQALRSQLQSNEE